MAANQGVSHAQKGGIITVLYSFVRLTINSQKSTLNALGPRTAGDGVQTSDNRWERRQARQQTV